MPSKTFFHLPAEKRERLLLAAEAEFARVPYAEASINRMIRAAGIPRGSFYMYFRDKEELFHYLLKRYQDGLLQRLERVLEEQGGDLLGALPALFDDLRAQRKHWAGLARMLSRNSDMRLGLRLSPLDRPDLGEWLERRVDRDRLDLRGEEDLMDIFRILIYISATAMTQAIFEEDSGPARARLCAQLDILRRGTAAPSATKT